MQCEAGNLLVLGWPQQTRAGTYARHHESHPCSYQRQTQPSQRAAPRLKVRSFQGHHSQGARSFQALGCRLVRNFPAVHWQLVRSFLVVHWQQVHSCLVLRFQQARSSLVLHFQSVCTAPASARHPEYRPGSYRLP